MVYDPKRIHQVETFGWDDGSEFLCITLVKLDLMIKSEDLGSLACQTRERLIRQINCPLQNAPALAKLIVSVPIPQPISRTFLPFHLSN